jgi:T-complex protein 1 subunit beta
MMLLTWFATTQCLAKTPMTTKSTATVLGAGCSEMLMSTAVDKLIKDVPGKESIAIESFAKALRQLPIIIADNAGYDSGELVSQLRSAHLNGESNMGLDMDKGEITDVSDSGLAITEALKSKMQVLVSAHEAAEMILRVDEIIKCAPRQRQQRR